MKRIIRIFFAIFIYIFLTVCAVLAATPSGKFVMERIVADDAGNIYLAGNGKNDIVVYVLDAEGIARGYYRCRREAQDTDILCGYYDGRVYISQTWQEAGVQRFSLWRADRFYRGFSCILQGTIENMTRFTDMEVSEGGIYLAGVDTLTHELVKCRYMISDKDLRVARYKTDYSPVTVCFGKNGLYTLAEDGQVYFTGKDGKKQLQGGFGKTQFLAADSDGVYWQEDGSRDINCLIYNGNARYVLREIGNLKDIEYTYGKQSASVLLSDPERLLIARHGGQESGNGLFVDAIKLSPRQMVESAMLPILMVTLTYIALLVAITLMLNFIKNKSVLLYRTLAAISVLSGLGLVSMMAIVHFQQSGIYSGMAFVVMAFAEWLVVMIIAILFLGYIWKNVDIIISWMDKISHGEYHIEEKKAPDNEFGMMWTALERMCKNLQVQKYRHTEVTDYLYQYAPKNFELLFDKENLHDVEVGETRQRHVTLGMISIIDKDTLHTGKLQRQYMQYVNRLMEILFSQKESEQAIFLQNESNLETVKVVFKEEESAPIAVRYSVGCTEMLLGQTQAQHCVTPFILLHTTVASCGLAGGSKQVYPYVISLEMETLGRYIERLKNSGAKLVVTGETWRQAEGCAEGRYIGYVSSDNGKRRFDLYEIIDACTQHQKLGRMRNRERFGRALELFYSDDLYLARSTFADILKECPDDGIVGWYVFACDELFNNGDMSDRRHELFGREESR